MPKTFLEGHPPRCTCTECKAHRAANQRELYKNGGKERMRAGHLLRKYGIATNQYDHLARGQKNLCAICREPETKTHKSGEPYELAVDHDHQTGIVRGLLCGNCNQALGLFRDDPNRLAAAIRYLQQDAPTLPAPTAGRQSLGVKVQTLPFPTRTLEDKPMWDDAGDLQPVRIVPKKTA